MPAASEPGSVAQQWLTAVERDVRGLLHDLASARSEAADAQAEHRHATQRLLVAIVEVLEAFERVLANAEGQARDKAGERLLHNFRTVHRLLTNVLRDQGVDPLVTIDATFDPRFHEVIETQESSVAPDTVLRELRTGYLWEGRVLRRTGVVVSRGPGSGDGGDAPWAG